MFRLGSCQTAQFRFALTTGLRSSAHSNDNSNRKKGTFLTSFDTGLKNWWNAFLIDPILESRVP